MYRTLSKRFEFAASHHCRRSDWPAEKNRSFYGTESEGENGHGHNFDLFAVFSGNINPQDGMIINVTDIKARVRDILARRYDHKYLNVDTAAFSDNPPTVENIAVDLLSDIRAAFRGSRARPVVCHLEMDAHRAATAYESGHLERHAGFDFDAIVRWHSPHLSAEHNAQLFGAASAESGVGRSFSARVTLDGQFDRSTGVLLPETDLNDELDKLRSDLQDKRLNDHFSSSTDSPFTHAGFSVLLYNRLKQSLPVSRIRLECRDGQFAEYSGKGHYAVGMNTAFYAAHRLDSPHLAEAENLDVYGKCNNPAGHGHRYDLEVTVTGDLDEQTGLPKRSVDIPSAVLEVIRGWNFRHLDRELTIFGDQPSTAENIIEALWIQIEERLGDAVSRLRLWETRNNRFALRRTV